MPIPVTSEHCSVTCFNVTQDLLATYLLKGIQKSVVLLCMALTFYLDCGSGWLSEVLILLNGSIIQF